MIATTAKNPDNIASWNGAEGLIEDESWPPKKEMIEAAMVNVDVANPITHPCSLLVTIFVDAVNIVGYPIPWRIPAGSIKQRVQDPQGPIINRKIRMQYREVTIVMIFYPEYLLFKGLLNKHLLLRDQRLSTALLDKEVWYQIQNEELGLRLQTRTGLINRAYKGKMRM